MRRDWELVREILIAVASGGCVSLIESSLPSKRKEQLEHVRLLLDAGYIFKSRSGGLLLTWNGHELLDAIREDGVWDKLKELVQAAGVGMTTDIVVTLAKCVTQGKISLASQMPPA